MLLGFSTGCLYKTHDRLAPSTFDIFRKMGCNAIELMWHETAPEEIYKLKAVSPEDLADFDYISIHAPSFDQFSEEQIVQMLDTLENLNKSIGFNTIVIHPYETMNWELFKKYDLPFAIENMDWRKDFGKYDDSLKDIFEKFDAAMVLDVNHCFTNDPSMMLAKQMFENFAERIKEIHVSGFETFHEPIYKTKQQEILDAIPDKSLPIIIESGCETIEDVENEFAYVKRFLEQ